MYIYYKITSVFTFAKPRTALISQDTSDLKLMFYTEFKKFGVYIMFLIF